MNYLKYTIFSIMFVAVTGCSLYKNPSEVASLNRKIPFLDASTINGSVSVNNIVAAAELPDDEMQYRMFSESLSKDLVSVLVRITNNSNKKILFNQGMLTTTSGDIDQLELSEIIDTLHGHFWLTVRMIPGGKAMTEAMNEKQRRDEAVTVNMYNKALKPAIISPNQTIQGFLFFNRSKITGRGMKVKLVFQKLTKVKYFDIQIPVSIPTE